MTGPRRWARGALVALDLGPAVVVLRGAVAVLVDAGEGTWSAWVQAGLPAIGPTAIALTGGEPARIGGLWSVLAGGTRGGRRAHHVLHGLDEERVPALAGAWEQSEGRRLGGRVVYEALLPGQHVELPGMRAACLPWGERPGVAWRLEAPEGRVLVAGQPPEAHRAVRAAAGVDLVVAPSGEVPGVGTWWRR